MKTYSTPQEEFWAGAFGDVYIERNSDAQSLASKTALFAKILSCVHGENIHSCLEYGSNIGLNLVALRRLIPGIKVSAVEINAKAAAKCAEVPEAHVYNKSIYEFDSSEQYDLTFVSGVLIHQNPEKLPEAYDQLYAHSRRYVLISEYYNARHGELSRKRRPPLQARFRGRVHGSASGYATYRLRLPISSRCAVSCG